ncbi:hypothetical protein [Streptomyces alanosinicus]|uniref:Uncharacterized protein n=1 Tax=Streptomyces alanosinicus TaxID=68171 RepID=A0A918YF25_9ACTN|nr:hypothetical protein [Streptomyces alanosinicus]GHE01604.1 hypothetical protein GCM10010339_21660 [Streptomyces alanosinicus]
MLLAPWCRKSPKISEALPPLYLHGLSSGDFVPALEQFLGDSELVIYRIGIEGSSGLGQPLALALAAAGYDVREVQPNRTYHRPASTPHRMLSGTSSPPSMTGGPPWSCSGHAS